MSKKLEAVAISGPTTDDNENLTKFSFKDPKYKDIIRHGVPEHFDFSWILTSPETLKSKEPHYYSWDKSEKGKQEEKIAEKSTKEVKKEAKKEAKKESKKKGKKQEVE